METAVTTAAPLVWSISKLIYKIIQAAELATQNKVECDDLVGRLSAIHMLLPRLQLKGPEAAEVLPPLGHTLNDAHTLVVACQKYGAPRKFSFSSAHAEKLSRVNHRIDYHLNLIQLCCHIDVARRLDEIEPRDHHHTTVLVLHPEATTTVAEDYNEVPWSESDNYAYSQSLQLVLWGAFLLSLMLVLPGFEQLIPWWSSYPWPQQLVLWWAFLLGVMLLRLDVLRFPDFVMEKGLLVPVRGGL